MIIFLLGTSAELIKTWPVLKKLEDRSDVTVALSGQHEIDPQLISLVLKHHRISSILPNQQTDKINGFTFVKWMGRFFVAVNFFMSGLSRHKKQSVFVVHGDTMTALIGAGVAKLWRRKVMHIEAGYRSGSWRHPFPEEIIRVILDRICDVSFCPTEQEAQNISKNKVAIVTHGNTGADAFFLAQSYLSSQPIVLAKDDSISRFGLVTIHRAELIYNEAALLKLLSTLSKISETVPLKFFLGKFESEIIKRLLGRFTHQIILLEKLSYLEFVNNVLDCEFVVTDSGGLQQECNYLGKTCYIVREYVEDKSLRSNCQVVGNDGKGLVEIFATAQHITNPSMLPLDPSPSGIILQRLLEDA